MKKTRQFLSISKNSLELYRKYFRIDPDSVTSNELLNKICTSFSFFPYENLILRCNDILDVNRDVIVSSLAELSLSRKIIIEDLNDTIHASRDNNKAVYLAK